MNFRFTIGRKLGLGFGILIFFIIMVFYLTYNTFSESKKINDEITEIYSPSVAYLEELKLTIVRSRLLINTWVNTPKDDSPDKKKLNNLVFQEYPHLKKKLTAISEHWEKTDVEALETVFTNCDELFEMHEEIKGALNSFDSYNDPTNKLLAEFRLEEDGDIYEKSKEILFLLDELINKQKHASGEINDKMLESFNFLKLLIIIFMIALPIFTLIIAISTTRSIVKPIDKLRHILLSLSKGVYPDKETKVRNDEIGDMTSAMNRLVSALKQTKDFANAVGSGKFQTNYEPLSENDSLGLALLKMRDDLAENERILEEKVRLRTAEVVQQKEEIEIQNMKINELYTQVTDSIKYAKRIQEAILPPDEQVSKLLPESFILYKPKDIVSGDFYWVGEKNNKIYVAAVDCTGHGVPGALMSIVGVNGLNYAFSVADKPSSILDELNKSVSHTLHQIDETSTKDGMDMSLASIDFNTNTIEFSGAYNPLFLVRNNEVIEIKGDRFPIGSVMGNEVKKFTNHELKLQSGDYIYLFSDGYADQFGGQKGKKFMYKQFRSLLIQSASLKPDAQRKLLDETLSGWQGNHEQVDDILVIGVKIS